MPPSCAKYFHWFILLACCLSGQGHTQETPTLNIATATRSLLWEQYGGLYRIYEPQLLTRFHALDLPGDADQDGDIDLQDCFLAADAFDTEDSYFDFNANGAVDIQDLLAVHDHYGQQRQGPFLVFNPKGAPLTNLQIADGIIPGDIRLYFTTPATTEHLEPFVFIQAQRPKTLADLDLQYQSNTIDYQVQNQTHIVQINAAATDGFRYVAFGYRDGTDISQILVCAWHFGEQYHALADLKSFLLHPAIESSYQPPTAPAITRFAVAEISSGLYEILIEANRFRFDARFWLATADETAATITRDGREIEILTTTGLGFLRRYQLAIPAGEWVLHGGLITRGGAIDDLATANIHIATPLVANTATRPTLVFADPQLEAAVRDAVGRPFGLLHPTDIANLSRLDASGRKIERLDGIEALSALHVLDLSSNAIADIAPLATLKKLISLHLRQNNIADLAPLQNLHDLDGIDLADNPITDLGPLVANAGLKINDTIDLRGNELSEHAIAVQIPALMGRRVFVLHRRAHRAPTPDRPDRTIAEQAPAVIVEEIVQEIVIAAPDPLLFVDPNLEAAIREAIAKPTDPIFPADVTELTTLDARNRDISNLGGIDQLIALESLQLNSNQIADVSPLADLGRLTTLHLNRNNITNINPLGEIDPLSELQVAGNQIEDITVLARLKSFTKLALNDNQISDLTPIADLAELESLQLNNNLISDLAPLAGLTGLRTLQLSQNQIADIAPLAALTRLRNLSLNDNEISDISDIAQLQELTILSIEKNQISDLSPLRGKQRLVLFEAANNRITDLSPLAGLSEVQVLTLGKNQIRSLAPLAGLNKLTRVLAGENQIRDIAALANKSDLFRIELHNNQISDISALAALPALDQISLDNNQITSIAALANNPGLQRGSLVFLTNNPLDPETNTPHITTLQDRKVTLQF